MMIIVEAYIVERDIIPGEMDVAIQVPVFFLDPRVQRIYDLDEAKKVARAVIDPVGTMTGNSPYDEIVIDVKYVSERVCVN